MRTLTRALKRLVFLLALTGSFAALHASANIVYTFSGVTLSDGGTLTGTFTTNNAINSLVDYDITTSGGSGFHYTTVTAPISFSSLPTILVVETASLSHLLQVTFNGGLTALGAPILIGMFDSFEQDPSGAHRQIVAGAAIVRPTTVPEPSTIALVSISVLGLLGFVRRRPRT